MIPLLSIPDSIVGSALEHFDEETWQKEQWKK
jgi:hypothetical protein